MNIFSCPICNEILNNDKKTYSCSNRHTYDIARSGYVNLLINQSSGGVHGDNKLMVNARKMFLDSGYYQQLLKATENTVASCCKSGMTLLDCGCGEGYYTDGICKTLLKKFENVDIFGIDISKDAIDFASKRCKEARFAVAGVFHLPVLDRSCDLLLTMFAPYCGEEFQRVLKTNGQMIMVIPGVRHLWELKQAIYAVPYLNQVKDYELDGFELQSVEKISYEIELNSNEEIVNLFSMTPYYYKTGKNEQEKLKLLEKLKTTVEFEIITYANMC